MSWQAGFAVVDLDIPGGKDMAGYGPMALPGTRGDESLFARALLLRCGAEEVALVAVDLMGASTWILHRAAIAAGIDEGRLVLAGTHTHTAPGRWYGAPFYDAFAHSLKLVGTFDEDLALHLVDRIAQAVKDARSDLRPATVAVGHALCWGAGANRSLAAFEDNPESESWPAAIGVTEHIPGDPRQRAVDPRVTAITARDDAGLIGALVTYGCHATSLGVKQSVYSRDWPGVALDRLRGTYGDRVAIAQGAAGDVSPLPAEVLADASVNPLDHQGPELAARRGEQVAHAARAAIDSATPVDGDLIVASQCWAPPNPDRWAVGWALLGAAEDARSSFHKWPFRCLKEGRPRTFDPDKPQSPKRVVKIARALRGFCHLSAYHRLHCIQLGEHRIFTVPGEPTAAGAARIETAMVDHFGGSASVLGYAADYAGYFTTYEEYLAQHYEGASNLYGRQSIDSLAAQYSSMQGVQPPPLRPEVAEDHDMQTALARGAVGTFVEDTAWVVLRHDGEPVATLEGRAPAAPPAHLGDDVWVLAFCDLDDPATAEFMLDSAPMALTMESAP